jgi:hypothetical protein
MDKAEWWSAIGCRRPIRTLLFATVLFVAQSPIVSRAQAQTDESSDWKFAGDFRLRYERTTQQEPTPEPLVLEPRNRGVVRFRAGVTKKFTELLDFGARLVTGSRDDPNSTDITLGDFGDGLEVSLDRAYLNLIYKDVFLTGGKFENPFLRTELVWDGDVNPQGAGVSYAFSGLGDITPKLTGIYYIVDEQTINPDSFMWGGQALLQIDPASDWNFMFSGAFYDYTIKSLRNADAGDTRSNRITPDGTAYVSDFDLLDAIAIVNYRGLGERYPIRFVGDFVKNLGAEDENQGIMLDLYIGGASKKDDRLFRYGYARAETDAVLAAFSNDNTTLPTNYVQHTLTFDYVVHQNMLLNATWYYYRRLKVEPENDLNPWISRLRLNAMVRF